MQMTKRLSIFLLFFFLLTFSSQAQTKLSVQSDSKISVDGGSTLHDWTAAVNQFEGTCTLGPALEKKSLKTGEAMADISLTCQVESMDGGRGAAMNKKIRTALKMTTHPQITFKASSASITEIKDKSAGTFTLSTKGELSMAGVTKEVELQLEGKRETTGNISLSGSKDLKMSTFDIEKPSAMFGQIVTKDDISIRFELNLSAN